MANTAACEPLGVNTEPPNHRAYIDYVFDIDQSVNGP